MPPQPQETGENRPSAPPQSNPAQTLSSHRPKTRRDILAGTRSDPEPVPPDQEILRKCGDTPSPSARFSPNPPKADPAMLRKNHHAGPRASPSTPPCPPNPPASASPP